MAAESKCPVTSDHTQHAGSAAKLNRDWWPNQLNLQVLHENSPLSNPMGAAPRTPRS
jgi:catalase-peroxidase